MNLNYARGLFPVLFALLLLTACAAATPDDAPGLEVPVTVLYSNSQCGASRQSFQAVWIDRPEGLQQIPGRVASRESLDRLRWNPDTEGALWLSMGRRPTGGYHLESAAPAARVQNGVATVRIRLQKPAADRFVTQVITSPCLLLKLPKPGINAVRIQDQNGRICARVDVTKN